MRVTVYSNDRNIQASPKILYIFPVMFLFMGLIFFAISSLMFYVKNDSKSRCTEEVAAVVSNLESRQTETTRRRNHHTVHSTSTTYCPEFTYTVDGQEYITKLGYYYSPCDLIVGQELTISYNPDDPKEIFVAEAGGSNLILYIFGGVGVVFIIIGSVAFIGIRKLVKNSVEMQYRDPRYWDGIE